MVRAQKQVNKYIYFYIFLIVIPEKQLFKEDFEGSLGGAATLSWTEASKNSSAKVIFQWQVEFSPKLSPPQKKGLLSAEYFDISLKTSTQEKWNVSSWEIVSCTITRVLWWIDLE